MLRSLTSSGPLRRAGFTILGGYASCALYFNIVDERFEEAKKSKGEKEKLEMRNLLQSCLRTSPTVGAIILTSLVVSHGVLSSAGASLAILITSLTLDSFSQTAFDPFDTRFLPREALHVSIVLCQIEGRVDLTTLPSQLISLNMCVNRLSGTVYLMELPKTLKSVNLHENHISVVVVDNASLPRGFQKAQFCNRRDSEKITVAEAMGNEIDKRITIREMDKDGTMRTVRT